ncbi:hypothetical protein PR202_ga15359 [Eleusine coracana subsp. coracana]|uniref:Uncharacterized protein n=1 Tax=Eleusine coracana subsp. coracana TaxID=191504 RepID=A0AAV5CJZ2_ELECO|nr:hypothetical protein PR202_ga15359 [Eleusine coracana subsp. coracana]
MPMPMPDKKTRKIKDRVAAVLEPRLIRVRRGNKKKKANSEDPLRSIRCTWCWSTDPRNPPIPSSRSPPAPSPALCLAAVAVACPARRRVTSPSVSRLRWHVLRRGEDAVRAPDGGRRCGTDNRLRPQDRHGSDGSPPRLPQAEPRPDPSRRQALRARPGTVCDGGTVGSRWHQLPPPPIFPCRLNPLEYRNPPKIRVASYAVVGSHILLSVEAETQQDKGTCAFDMNAKQWEMVDDKNLPFIGQAVSLGSRRFIVRSRAKGGAATVYYMDVFLSRNTNTGKTELSIVEVPVASKGIVPGQLLCSMGKDSFTSFDIQSLDPSPEAKPDRARIVYRTYSMVSGDDGETSSVVKEQRQIFKIRGRFTRLAQPFPVAAVLTM